MPLKAIKINISAPSVDIPRGRGFYQLEEEELYFPIIHSKDERNRFFSYLESDTVSLQLDREGRLIFIVITLPRRRWKDNAKLTFPDRAQTADIRFLDFRDSFPNPKIHCDPTQQNILLKFNHSTAGQCYYLAENLIAQINSKGHLSAVWATDIIDDLAGREIASWRKAAYGGKLSRSTREGCLP
jgi:hypothetical protein